MKLRYLLLNFLLLLIWSCEDQTLEVEDCASELLVCTDEFRIISLEILDQNDHPVILDSYYTFVNSRKRYQISTIEYDLNLGVYPVVTDNQRKDLATDGSTLIFVGEKDGVNIVEHQMVIMNNCCHIELIGGLERIQIRI